MCTGTCRVHVPVQVRMLNLSIIYIKKKFSTVRDVLVKVPKYHETKLHKMEA